MGNGAGYKGWQCLLGIKSYWRILERKAKPNNEENPHPVCWGQEAETPPKMEVFASLGLPNH